MAIKNIDKSKKTAVLVMYQAFYVIGICAGLFFTGIFLSFIGLKLGFIFVSIFGLITSAFL